MKVLVLGHKKEDYGILVQIECEKMAKRIVKLAQTDRAQAILEILEKGCILRTVEAEELCDLSDTSLILREGGTCWDLM